MKKETMKSFIKTFFDPRSISFMDDDIIACYPINPIAMTVYLLLIPVAIAIAIFFGGK